MRPAIAHGLDHVPGHALLGRRGFLVGAAALLAIRPLGATGIGSGPGADPLVEGWLATAGMSDGFAAVGLDGAFSATTEAETATRLHGIEASPTGPLAVAVGRRPGQIALVFDRRRGGLVATLAPGAGRVFSGHGRFTADGRLFLTNEIERPQEGTHAMGRGVVAVRSVDGGFVIVSEWPSGGDGPHDLMQSGAALVVANGGIEPNTPEARDAEVTGSGISLLDPASGAVRGEGRLSGDLASLSLRHLARDGTGGTVVAAQDLLKDGEARPLLFRIAADGTLSPFDAPDAEWRALRGYVGSVAYDPSGRHVACASPRGNRVAVWRADGRFLGSVPLADGCALAAGPEAGTFVAASGYGEVILVSASPEGVGIAARRTGGPRFDNHMVRIG
ncbi:DUF1513 domain-containing protein [Xanthobacter autotrophicus]|uniref:DUF1513 domain-containing protein n=1 Tax=Xanthobacter TaxID=279 RepID=UPI0024AACC22|nr:DUF1513 domain-containing protein [Xanthobacter autotrophicus]MDI4663758.1 DUF1513 domain-containing protein [Xanthobacter autotrophicus]